MTNDTAILILAAGKGTRMGSELPKVLITLNEKPLIQYLLESLTTTDYRNDIYVVVGYKSGQVIDTLPNNLKFITQAEQLGTGHAVMCAREALQGVYKNVLVLYGDMPFVTPETIKNIVNTHNTTQTKLTMATITVDDFDGWKSGFYDFGRIIRNEKGAPIKITEKKDASEKELKIKEVNPSYFCFDSDWLWKNIKLIKNENSQKEYYLTDLLAQAIKTGSQISTVAIDAREGIGINTPDQLAVASSITKKI